MPTIAQPSDPFDESLWGEYARMLMVATAGCSAMAWACRLPADPSAVFWVVGNVLVLAIAAGRWLAEWPRLLFLSLLASGILGTLVFGFDSTVTGTSLAIFSLAFMIVSVVVLGLRDAAITMRHRSATMSPRKIVLIAVIMALAIYMIAIPAIDAILEQFRDRPSSYTIEELTAWEVLRIRTAKLSVFAIFAYAGACVGSFLNVVAASTPLGEPIALRSSACPKCGTPIRRIDNLPIISYSQLRGRCRSCQSPIPIRYFIVEWVGLAIFGLLFLYELITGAANVPGFPNDHHAGILWIILYTKWPVVGIYFFHCVLFSCLLMLALMEQERLLPPRWMKLALPVVFAVIAIAFPAMLTAALTDQTGLTLPAAIPDWADRAASSIGGGLIGWTIGRLAGEIRLRKRQSNALLSTAMALLGIAMGWQAVLTIAAIWLVAACLLQKLGPRRSRPRWLTATTLLFAAAMLHHPLWRWLAGLLSVS